MSQQTTPTVNKAAPKKKLLFTKPSGEQIITSPKPAAPASPTVETPKTPQISEKIPPKVNKKPSIVINKPVLKKLSLSLNAMSHSYKLEEMLQFRTELLSKHKKFNFAPEIREKFIELESNLKRYEFRKGMKAPIPESERVKRDIRTNLNKLTMDKFSKIYDKITDNPSFHTDVYLKILADLIHEQAIQQKLFSNLYSLFVSAILQSVNESDTKALYNTFLERVRHNCTETLNAPLPTDAAKCDEAFCHATYYGCLAMRGFIDLQDVFKEASRLVGLGAPIALSIVAKILVPCGSKLEEAIPEFKTDILPPLQAITTNKEVPGHLRYFIIDLLDARENNWATAELMDQVYDKRNAASGKASIYSSVGQPQSKSDKPTIKAGTNKFAGLLDDDEEEEEYDEEEPFDGRGMVREWINDQELAEGYEARFISALIRGLIVGSPKEMQKALPIFAALKDKNLFEKEETLSSLITVVEEFESEVNKKDFPLALSYAAAILATLVNMEDASIDDYQKVFVLPEIRCASMFMDKVNDTVLDQIAENQWWQELKWKPEESSAMTVLKNIPEKAAPLFELYDNLNAVWGLIDDKEMDPHEIAESITKETPEHVFALPNFAIGTVEILLASTDDETMLSEILPIFKNFDMEILKFVEVYGRTQDGLNNEKLAQYLKSIADAGKYDIAQFKAQNFGPEHASVAALL